MTDVFHCRLAGLVEEKVSTPLFQSYSPICQWDIVVVMSLGSEGTKTNRYFSSVLFASLPFLWIHKNINKSYISKDHSQSI